MEDSECLLNDDYESLIQQREKNCAEDSDIAAKYGKVWTFCREYFAAFASSKKVGDLVTDKVDLLKDNVGNTNEATDNTSVGLGTTCPNNDDITSPQEVRTNNLITDDKTISEERENQSVFA